MLARFAVLDIPDNCQIGIKSGQLIIASRNNQANHDLREITRNDGQHGPEFHTLLLADPIHVSRFIHSRFTTERKNWPLLHLRPVTHTQTQTHTPLLLTSSSSPGRSISHLAYTQGSLQHTRGNYTVDLQGTRHYPSRRNTTNHVFLYCCATSATVTTTRLNPSIRDRVKCIDGAAQGAYGLF